MPEHRTNTAWIAVLLIALLVPLAVYIGGYHYLCIGRLHGHQHDYPPYSFEVRIYKYRRTADIFSPAAQVDSLIRGRDIRVYDDHSDDF